MDSTGDELCVLGLSLGLRVQFVSTNQDKPFWCLCCCSVLLCSYELHKSISSTVGLVP